MNDEGNWQYLFINEASARHLGTRSILERWRGDDKFIDMGNRHQGLTRSSLDTRKVDRDIR